MEEGVEEERAMEGSESYIFVGKGKKCEGDAQRKDGERICEELKRM